MRGSCLRHSPQPDPAHDCPPNRDGVSKNGEIVLTGKMRRSIAYLALASSASSLPVSQKSHAALVTNIASDKYQGPFTSAPPPVVLNMDLGLNLVRVPRDLPEDQAAVRSPKLEDPTNYTPGVLCATCTPTDVDDAMVLAWALNLRENSDKRVKIVASTQTFGNADAATACLDRDRLLAAKNWTTDNSPRSQPGLDEYAWFRNANGRGDPLPFSHSATAAPLLDPNGPLPVYDLDDHGNGEAYHTVSYSDAAASGMCKGSASPRLMAHQMALETQSTTIVATGPLGDIACLVSTFPYAVPKIKEIAILAGRAWGQGLVLKVENGMQERRGLSDFNIRMDAEAARYLVHDAKLTVRGFDTTRLVFFPFELSSSWHNTATSEMMLHETGGGPTSRSWRLIVGNSWLRGDWYERVFKLQQSRIWLWDLYPWYYALEPSAFNCREALARVVRCESDPARGKHFFAANNTCADHTTSATGEPTFKALAQEPMQLFLATRDEPTPPECARDPDACSTVKVCDEFASDQAEQQFLKEALEQAFH